MLHVGVGTVVVASRKAEQSADSPDPATGVGGGELMTIGVVELLGRLEQVVDVIGLGSATTGAALPHLRGRVPEGLRQRGGVARGERRRAVHIARVRSCLGRAPQPHDRIDAGLAFPERFSCLQRPDDIFRVTVARGRDPVHLLREIYLIAVDTATSYLR